MPRYTLFTFKPIRVPLSRLPDPDLAEAILLGELQAFAQDLKSDFEATTSKWRTKPKFVINVSLSGNKATYTVYTSSKVYKWVSSGTKKHPEAGKRKFALKLALTKLNTATKITWITKGAIKHPKLVTRQFMSAVIVAYVKRQGIKARNYPQAIMRKRKPEFSPRMHAAIQRWAAANRR